MRLMFISHPFGIDLFCLGRKFLVLNLVSRNLKIKYRRSILGVLWTLLVPIAMGLVYYFVFKLVLRIQIPHYLAFILSGVLPWNFFSQSISENLESVVGNWGIVSKVPVPVQVFPYVGTLTNLVTLMISLPILVGAALISDVALSSSFLLLPFLFVALFLITYFSSIILAVVFVYFRDLRHIITIVLQILFYATPVIYDQEMIPGRFQWVIHFNPLASIFIGIHKVLVSGAWLNEKEIGIIVLWCLIFYVGSSLFYKHCVHEVVENI